MPIPAFKRLKRVSRSSRVDSRGLRAKKKEAKEICISLASHKKNADTHTQYQVNNCKMSLQDKSYV